MRSISTFDETPYRMAGMLALELMRRFPDLPQHEAITYAWHAWRYCAGDNSMFRAEIYAFEVGLQIKQIGMTAIDQVDAAACS